jgi:hypothetical protein
VLHHIEGQELADEFEQAEIQGNLSEFRIFPALFPTTGADRCAFGLESARLLGMMSRNLIFPDRQIPTQPD